MNSVIYLKFVIGVFNRTLSIYTQLWCIFTQQTDIGWIKLKAAILNGKSHSDWWLDGNAIQQYYKGLQIHFFAALPLLTKKWNWICDTEIISDSFSFARLRPTSKTFEQYPKVGIPRHFCGITRLQLGCNTLFIWYTSNGMTMKGVTIRRWIL